MGIIIKMVNETLNPNCSEIVWRLNIPAKIRKSIKEEVLKALEDEKDDRRWTSTDTYPNDCINDILDSAEGVDSLDDCSIELLDNDGGGGDSYYVEECLDIAKRIKSGEITKKEGIKLEKKAWG